MDPCGTPYFNVLASEKHQCNLSCFKDIHFFYLNLYLVVDALFVSS